MTSQIQMGLLTLAIALLALSSPAWAQEASPGAELVRTTEADSAFAQAMPAAKEWLALLDSDQYAQSWQEATPRFQEALPMEEWEQRAAEARDPLEPFGARTLVSIQFATLAPDLGPGRYVVLQYLTPVGEGRSAIETVSLERQPEGDWRIAGYFVRPR
ncbi:MAG: DUF4019 domain-containing protein [Gemmatimonadota bacterium]